MKKKLGVFPCEYGVVVSALIKNIDKGVPSFNSIKKQTMHTNNKVV